VRLKLLIVMLLSLSAHAASVGDQVKCQGYLELKGKREYYELQGKVLKNEGRYLLIYGFTPVFSAKRLHKVLSASCISPDEEFIEELVVTEEGKLPAETVEEIKHITVKDIDHGPEKSASDETRLGGQSSKNEVPENKAISKKASNPPIHSKTHKKKDHTGVSAAQSDDECDGVSKRGFLVIIKCFIRDGYGDI